MGKKLYEKERITLIESNPFLRFLTNNKQNLSDLYFKGIILRTYDGGGVLGIENIFEQIPKGITLYQNYPNPFNPNTKIRFTILKIYDILGNEVATLVNEELTAGKYEVEFNATNGRSGFGGSFRLVTAGRSPDGLVRSATGGLSSGVYFYQLKAGEFISTKKLVLIK